MEETYVIGKKIDSFFRNIREKITEVLYDSFRAKPRKTYKDMLEEARYYRALDPDCFRENIDTILEEVRYNIAILGLSKKRNSNSQ